jgi:O-methyltransferase
MSDKTTPEKLSLPVSGKPMGESRPWIKLWVGPWLEAGCFKGGSTAKLSLGAQLSGRKLLVFDAFEGLPDPVTEQEKLGFSKGAYEGSLEEVQKNVHAYGAIEVCEFFPGWFRADTAEPC